MTRYRLLERAGAPTAGRIAYRDRWAGDELDRLREALWAALQRRVATESMVLDHTLDEVDAMRRKFTHDGKRLARHPLARLWGRWLLKVAAELRRWGRHMRDARAGR